MSVNLTEFGLPARVQYELSDGSWCNSVIAYLYSDGKVLTTSATVLDPSKWRNIKLMGGPVAPMASPPWADPEQAEKWQGEKRTPITVSAGEGHEHGEPTVERKPPMSVTRILPEDDIPLDEMLRPVEEND